MEDALPRMQTPLLLSHTFQWEWGSDSSEPATAVPGEDVEFARYRAHLQGATVQTLWRLAQQFVPVRSRAPRGLRRDAKRKWRRDVSDVNVVVLRRAAMHPDGYVETDRHYTCSFLVHGYFAVRHTREGPKQVYVVPHLKGEGPFREKKRAWELKR
jgi:hypothetical protein